MVSLEDFDQTYNSLGKPFAPTGLMYVQMYRHWMLTIIVWDLIYSFRIRDLRIKRSDEVQVRKLSRLYWDYYNVTCLHVMT
jgi:hypothetical protein